MLVAWQPAPMQRVQVKKVRGGKAGAKAAPRAGGAQGPSAKQAVPKKPKPAAQQQPQDQDQEEEAALAELRAQEGLEAPAGNHAASCICNAAVWQ